MEIRRCENGHFYDAEANSTCPQCAAEMGGGNIENYGATEPLGGGKFENYGATEPLGGSFGNYGTTEPLGGGFENYGATEPIGGFAGNNTGNGVQDYGATEPLWQNQRGMTGHSGNGTPSSLGVMDYNDVTQPINVGSGNAVSFSPVTGWLVCTEGPAKGSDYRIQTGYNYIGRSEHMDICIRGDMKISREKHAMVAYDHEEQVFFFGPADGKSLVRLNGKIVMTPMEIHAYDVLTVGTTKLLFIPLCGERFKWDE